VSGITVLLVPPEGDPRKMLAEGPLGARPPTAWFGHRALAMGGHEKEASWHGGLPDQRGSGAWDDIVLKRALVLIWKGQSCEQGIFSAWFRADDELGEVLSEALYEEITYLPELVAGWRREGESLGTVVQLDASGNEILGGHP